MDGRRPEPLGWSSDHSEASLRDALAAAAPHLASLPITLDGTPDLSKPLWASSRARVGGRVFAKFAHSEQTAVRIWREAQVLGLLGGELRLPVPKLVAAGRDPVFLSTEVISGGAPLSYMAVAAASPSRIAQFAEELAVFLAQLHAPRTLTRATEEIDSLPALPQPGLHVWTDRLRERFTTMVDPRLAAKVSNWCDWIDHELSSAADTVLVHGDFHPYNQLWDLDEARLLAVVDYESSGLAEPEFDFRVLPAFGPGVDLLVATMTRYEALSTRKVNLRRTMALFLLNYLGDAFWRTEAGIGLPEPGDSPSAYVEEAARRLADLDISP